MSQQSNPPNVLTIIADDLTYGDLGCYGNPSTHTPNLDTLYSQSTRWERHTSGSLCTPARSMLMTGRYAYRTRAFDTYCGRSMMDPDERTIASLLNNAGYGTCLSGKWHLGDCYPMRPQDMGFDEVLMHNGGGLCQPANHGHDDYFDPELMHNGRLTPFRGYCTDIFADHAISFIRQNKHHPFFCYLATNTPHTPCLVGDDWARPHFDAGFDRNMARLYGMIDNLDMNIGRVLQTLDDLGLGDNTLVYFTSDHGCQSGRFNAGLRGGKGTPYDGGIRTPAFWRWPGHVPSDRDVRCVTGQIDVLPTIAQACNTQPPDDRIIDGQSILPRMTTEPVSEIHAQRENRYRVIQWHRGDVPIRYHNVAVVGDRFKLCIPANTAEPELYETREDPGEINDLAADQPQQVKQMLAFYDAWFDEVANTRPDNFAPPRIVIGSPKENPTVLNMNDWRVDGEDGFNEHIEGRWMVHILQGRYDVELRFSESEHEYTAHLRIGDQTSTMTAHAASTDLIFRNQAFDESLTEVRAYLEGPQGCKSAMFVIFHQRRSSSSPADSASPGL